MFLGCGSEGPTIDLDFETLIGCDEVSQGCDESSCNQGGPIKILPVVFSPSFLFA